MEFVVAGLVLLFIWGRIDLIRKKNALAVLEAELTWRREAEAFALSRLATVRDQLDRERDVNEDFHRRRQREFDRRTDELHRQIQNMAERLAGLTLEQGVVVTSDAVHVEDEGPREPFPEAVNAFLEGIEGAESRALVEDQVYRLRDIENLGWDDILLRIRQGAGIE